MIGNSDNWWPFLPRPAAAASGFVPDERWRRNNRIATMRQPLSPRDRRNVAQTAAGALLGLVLIAAAAIGTAAIAPVQTDQPVVMDDSGTILDLAPAEDAESDHD